jgi:hypothetical protein
MQSGDSGLYLVRPERQPRLAVNDQCGAFPHDSQVPEPSILFVKRNEGAVARA